MRCSWLATRLQPMRVARHASRAARLCWAAGTLLLTGSLFAAAIAARPAKQVGTSAPPFAAAWDLSVGSGGTYEARCERREACTLNISVVGAQRVAGGEGRWIEVSSRPEGTAAGLVHKVLVQLGPKGMRFVRAVAQVPGHPPMELPKRWLMAWARGDSALASGYVLPTWVGVPTWAGGPFPFGDYQTGGLVGGFYDPGYYPTFGPYPDYSKLIPPSAGKVGTQTIATKAGTFVCQHWRYRNNLDEVWVSKGAGPFGIVKAVFREKKRPHAVVSRIILTRVTTSARDQITGQILRPDGATLWGWIFRERNGPLRVCLPWLGLPAVKDW